MWERSRLGKHDHRDSWDNNMVYPGWEVVT